jgi:hypothetical protein
MFNRSAMLPPRSASLAVNAGHKGPRFPKDGKPIPAGFSNFRRYRMWREAGP